jgi:hypothetical protein
MAFGMPEANLSSRAHFAQMPKTIANLTWWYLVCQKYCRIYSAKKTSPVGEEICRARIKTDQGAVHHG